VQLPWSSPALIDGVLPVGVAVGEPDRRHALGGELVEDDRGGGVHRLGPSMVTSPLSEKLLRAGVGDAAVGAPVDGTGVGAAAGVQRAGVLDPCVVGERHVVVDRAVIPPRVRLTSRVLSSPEILSAAGVLFTAPAVAAAPAPDI